MPCRLWLLGWRDVDASLCSGLLAAMPRCLRLRLRIRVVEEVEFFVWTPQRSKTMK